MILFKITLIHQVPKFPPLFIVSKVKRPHNSGLSPNDHVVLQFRPQIPQLWEEALV